MRKPFWERLAENVIVCDGAMGTQLYAKGVFLNRCFDELNLQNPSLVREVHQEYVWAGAEILESNTFGANRLKLEPHGLADRVREINIAGVRLAREAARDSLYVAGSVGPLGIRVEPYGKLGIDEARQLFAEQIAALVEAGADLLSLETFFDLNELRAALLAARDICSLPVMAQVTLEEDGNSLDGTPPESFGMQLETWGADIIGVNCGVGPQIMLESIERMAQAVTRKMIAQPNAGKPRSFEGRNLYLSSPEYLATYAKRFIRAGVQIVGGCCGTTPAHIKAIRETVRAMTTAPPKAPSVSGVASRQPVETIPVEKRSHLAQSLHERRFVTIVDLTSPRGSDPSEALEAARFLKKRGADAVRICDASPGSASMGAMALAVLIDREVGLETILRYTCGERTLLTMQSELLGAHAMGLRNLFLSTGDPIRVGDYIDATAVFDVDAVGATHLVAGLNQARDLGGKSIGRPTGFYIGVSVDPAALNMEDEIRALEYKVQAGAQFAVTEPIFRQEVLEVLQERMRDFRIPLIAAIRPLAGYQEAEFLNNEMPGISIPQEFLQRLRDAGSPEREQREGVAIAREILGAVRGMVQGIDIIAASPALVLQVLEV